MLNKTEPTIGDKLNIISTIASKDIVDAFKNKVVLSLIIMLSVILLVPKLLPYIFEQTSTVLPVYDMGDSALMANILKSPELSIQELHSEEELKIALCSGIYPEIGLVLPSDFDQVSIGGGQLEFQGFVCWSKRHQVSALQANLEGLLSQSLGQTVSIRVNGNIVYPPAAAGLYLSLATINAILLILMIGIFIVPSLILEEKESKTMQALLVSPASITQVVTGKALAGLFYTLISGILIFFITRMDVVHWDMVILFIISSGVFSVAVGLLLGSLFDKQQDMVGWMIALLLIMIGAVMIKALGIELPYVVRSLLLWVPSVALAEIYRAALSEIISTPQVWTNFGIVLTVSLLLYAIVIYRIRRSDR